MRTIIRISGTILVIFLIHCCKKGDDSSIPDIDGNSYNIITIGSQVWMKENLKTTKYNDGEIIPLVQEQTAWSNLFTEGCCRYENNTADSKENYGLLYNWHTVQTGKLCPKGWHVPSDGEWHTLVVFLDDSASYTVYESLTAGDKLKETGNENWIWSNTGATNETGFTALPGGYRSVGGIFAGLGGFGAWWSSTEVPENNGNAITRVLDGTSMAGRSFGCKNEAYSVRCIRNK